MIPKIIHAFWFQGKSLPSGYAKSVDEVKRLNPDWQFMLWSDAELEQNCRQFGDSAIRCYNSFQYMHQKIDFGRLITLAIHGGVSVDLDITVHKPFAQTPGLKVSKLIVSKSARSRAEMILFSAGRLASAFNNAILFCEPDSKYLKTVIHDIILNSICGYRSRFVYFTIQWSTGPFVFTQFLERQHIADDEHVRILPPQYFEFDKYHPSAIISHHHHNTWLPGWFRIAKCYVVKIISVFWKG